jgi:hypothetical protein
VATIDASGQDPLEEVAGSNVASRVDAGGHEDVGLGNYLASYVTHKIFCKIKN